MATSKIQTGLRLNELVYEKLKVISTFEQRSLNNLIEFIVQKYVDEYEQLNGSVLKSDEQ